MCISGCNTNKTPPPGATPNAAQPANSTCVSCAAALNDPDVAAAVKILCANNARYAVSELRKTTVTVADGMVMDDWEFDGTKWVPAPMPVAGLAGGGVLLESGQSDEQKAITLFHEAWHMQQRPGMGQPHPAEDDAWGATELWTIQQGLPSQGGTPPRSLRKRDKNGNVTVDLNAIRDEIDGKPASPGQPPGISYPGQPRPGSNLRPVGYDPANNRTEFYDPATKKKVWKPSAKGDKVSDIDDIPRMLNPRVIDPKAFQCP